MLPRLLSLFGILVFCLALAAVPASAETGPGKFGEDREANLAVFLAEASWKDCVEEAHTVYTEKGMKGLFEEISKIWAGLPRSPEGAPVLEVKKVYAFSGYSMLQYAIAKDTVEGGKKNPVADSMVADFEAVVEKPDSPVSVSDTVDGWFGLSQAQSLDMVTRIGKLSMDAMIAR